MIRAWLVLAMAACGDKDPSEDPTGSPADTDTDTDADSDADTDTSTTVTTATTATPWASATRTGYNFNGLQSASWDGGEDLTVPDPAGGPTCQVAMGAFGAGVPGHDCADCLAVWDVQVYSGGAGPECAPFGLDQPTDVDRLMGYAPSVTYGGTAYTDALLAKDPAAGWRPIGVIDPQTADYVLFAGEPSWEY